MGQLEAFFTLYVGCVGSCWIFRLFLLRAFLLVSILEAFQASTQRFGG